MGLMQKLYETYENNAHMAGVTVAGKTMLAPICHMIFNVQIEITLTPEGDFHSARSVAKEDRETLIPSIEEAAGRTSGAVAFPLSDQLQYVALGAPSYPAHKKYEEKYEKYMRQIKDWAESEYSHPKVRAIYAYCQKGEVVHDLAASGIINLDANGLLTSDTIEKIPYEKCVVRWRVLTMPWDGDAKAEAWQDTSLIQSYIQYSSARMTEKTRDFCYISGDFTEITSNHAKGLVRNASGAKLVSVNDMDGFTFRGRFIGKNDPMVLGASAGEKAHNALKWLTANQGVTMGDRTFLCWNPKGKDVPSIPPMENVYEETQEAYTMPQYRAKVYKALNFYSENLDDNDDILILSLEAATTGRLSVTYYNELKASDFLERIQKWQETCCWYFYKQIMTPATQRIVECAFGTEQNKKLQVDKKVLNQHAQRILSCVVEAQFVPPDIVQALVTRASMPQAFSEKYNYEQVLSTACALVRKYKNDNKGSEVWKMILDESNTDRSYLYGRLLAILEAAERSTYSQNETRETNAIRMQTQFARHPQTTWAVIDDALRPYFLKMAPGLRKYYKDLINDIVDRLRQGDYTKLDQKLDSVYLLGYHLQRKELYTKQDKK